MILTDETQARRFADKVKQASGEIRAWFEQLLKDLVDILDKAYSALSKEQSWEQMELIRKDKNAIQMIADAYFDGMEGAKGKGAEGEKMYSLHGVDDYTDSEKEAILRDKKNSIATSTADIENFINEHIEKRGEYRRLFCGKLSSKLASRVLDDTQKDLTGASFTIDSYYENAHADAVKEAQRGQVAITPEIIAKLPAALENYTKVEYSGLAKDGREGFVFEVEIDGRKIAVEYYSSTRRSLTLYTMYGWGAANKKSLSATSGAGASDRTSETTASFGSNSSIRTSGAPVNQSAQNEATIERKAIKYSLVDDSETLDFLNDQDFVTVYRAMQLIDGNLYPPMAARIKGENGKKELVSHSTIGKWEQADERPELIRSGNKYELDKANGSSIEAAYNPYYHTSRSMLNDQFSSAYKRDNLVVVEGVIPKSELTSGYRAENAKDAVGEMTWHSGPVSSRLKGNKERRVILSRWFKPVRIVPNSEVASSIFTMLDGEGIEVPSNVVTPSLAKELIKHGVPVSGMTDEVSSKPSNDNASIKLSLRDDTYMRAVESGDMETAQKMVDDAAKDAGYDIKAYHGTSQDFSVFDKGKVGSNYGVDDYGFFFSSQRDVAEYVADDAKYNIGGEAKVLSVHLKISDPFKLTLSGDAITYFDNHTEEIINLAVADNDGIVLNGYNGSLYVTFNSEQIKSADPVTYDDNGNVIPLSQRFNVGNEDIRFSIKDGMTEEERYAELKDARLNAAAYDGDTSKLTPAEVTRLENATRRDARRYVKILYEKFGVGKRYANQAAEIEFMFGDSSFSKSVHEQAIRGNEYAAFSKMLACFDEIIENAIPLEIHTDKYAGTNREDSDLQRVYVLISAYADSGIIPVQLEVKEFREKDNRLYLAVTLHKIEDAVVATESAPHGAPARAVRIFDISLREMFENINPSDGEFLKYVPDGFLNEEQKASKQLALEKEQRKIEGYRFSLKDVTPADTELIQADNEGYSGTDGTIEQQLSMGLSYDEKAVGSVARAILKQYIIL